MIGLRRGLIGAGRRTTITTLTFWSIGTTWGSSATSPIVAITEESPSASGTSPATSDPKTSTRISSVSGSERIPALPSWLENSWLSALVELTAPAWPT
jgi:hypothetical protein